MQIRAACGAWTCVNNYIKHNHLFCLTLHDYTCMQHIILWKNLKQYHCPTYINDTIHLHSYHSFWCFAADEM